MSEVREEDTHCYVCETTPCRYFPTIPNPSSVEHPLSKPRDDVNHPSHYTSSPSGIECIEVVEHMNYCLGNVVKYVWRCDKKGKHLQDLKKARWYLDREIQRLEKLEEEEKKDG